MIIISLREKEWSINNILCVTTSPRRIRLLKNSFQKIRFIAPSYKEKKIKYFISPILLSIYYAFRKSQNIKYNKNDTVLSFDTIVFRNYKIYTKTDNREGAVKTSRELNNKAHRVVTGICIRHNKRVRFHYEISRVKFKKLSEEKITDYIAAGEWKDKAGGYGIQGKGRNLIEWHKGDYYNIVGLPLDLIKKIVQA